MSRTFFMIHDCFSNYIPGTRHLVNFTSYIIHHTGTVTLSDARLPNHKHPHVSNFDVLICVEPSEI